MGRRKYLILTEQLGKNHNKKYQIHTMPGKKKSTQHDE
jgi:hypothetical protein